MFLAVNKISSRYFSNAFFLFLLGVSLVSENAYANKKNATVQDLNYGAALYAYYQQDYFTALSELLIAEKKQSLQHHADFAEILRGGIHLSYGMDKEAEQLFYSAISTVEKKEKSKLGKSKKASHENIARAWFYLGKLLYKKGDYTAANEKFSKVSRSLTRSLRPEYAFLSASARQRLSIPLKESSSKNSEEGYFSPRVNAYSSWRFYTDYNQLLVELNGINNLLRSEDNTQNQVLISKKKIAIAEKMLALALRINDSHALEEVEELLALQDQIYTAAGFLFLQSEKSKRAISSFKRIRQNSVLVGQALLGYGWAAVNVGDYQAALIPWQQLAKRSMLEPTTHEALLAVPFVYEKLNANAAALTAYGTATEALQQELSVLSDIQEKLKTLEPKALQRYYSDKAVTWLDEQLDEQDHDAKEQRQLFVEDLLQNRMLALLSQNHFNLLEKQNQDVQWLIRALNNWQTDLETVRFVVDARQERSAVAINTSARDTLQKRFTQLKLLNSRLTTIKKQSSDGVSVDSVRSLMNPKEKNSLRRIEHAEMIAERIEKHLQTVNKYKSEYQSDDSGLTTTAQMNKEQLVAYKSKISALKGLLHWQVSNDSMRRQWQSQKILTSVGRELVLAEESLINLGVLAEKSALQMEERAMAESIQQRILSQQQQAMSVAEKINQKILVLLQDDVVRLKRQATVYLAQASLARARLLDTLSLDATSPDLTLDSAIDSERQSGAAL